MASDAVDIHDDRPTYSEAAVDLVTRPLRESDSRVLLVALGLSALLVLGFVGLSLRLIGGVSDYSKWGYYAALVSFLLTTAGGAPMVAIAPALAKANWVRPISRIAQMFSVVGILTALMHIPLIFVLPPLVEEGIRRRSIWFGSSPYTPHIFDTIAIAGLAFIGLGLLWANSVPDLAAIREAGTGWRQRWARRLAPGFVGTVHQWKALRVRIGMLGAGYFLFLIFTHIVFASDFALAMVAGWKDAIFPMYHALTSLQAGVATTIIATYFIRRWGRLERYIGITQFWSLAKLQLALSLLWFYFFFSAFIVFWYGRTTVGGQVIDLFITGPYWWAFLAVFFLSFLIPMWTLMWNKVRVSIVGPTVIAGAIILGTLIDRIRIYVAAWSTDPKGINHEVLTDDISMLATIWPDMFDIFMILGALGGAALLFLAATRFIPTVSLWEIQHSRLISGPAKFVRAEVEVVGKPD